MNSITEIKNTLEENNHRLEDTEEQTSTLEESNGKQPSQTAQRKSNIQNEIRLREFRDKCSNTCIIRFQKEKREKREQKNLFEIIIPENFPNPGREKDIQTQEAQRSSNKINSKRSSSMGHIIKMTKISDRKF